MTDSSYLYRYFAEKTKEEQKNRASCVKESSKTAKKAVQTAEEKKHG